MSLADQPACESVQNSLSVCIVEDHAAIRRALRLLIQTWGFQVLGEAADGASGIQLILQERPDVAVVDWRLPEVSGRELIKRVLSRWPQAKLVVVSAAADESDIDAALSAGAASFVPKEVIHEELAGTLRRVAEESSNGGGFDD